MKFVAAVACLASAVAALPAEALVPRQSNVAVTDQLMFGITLPAFSTRRANRDPPTLDWTTDGCTSSPDNPFGFPFLVSLGSLPLDKDGRLTAARPTSLPATATTLATTTSAPRLASRRATSSASTTTSRPSMSN